MSTVKSTKTNPRKLLVPQDTVPTITVVCAWEACPQFGIETDTPAGVLLTDGVLMSGSMSCTECGMHMNVVGGT